MRKRRLKKPNFNNDDIMTIIINVILLLIGSLILGIVKSIIIIAICNLIYFFVIKKLINKKVDPKILNLEQSFKKFENDHSFKLLKLTNKSKHSKKNSKNNFTNNLKNAVKTKNNFKKAVSTKHNIKNISNNKKRKKTGKAKKILKIFLFIILCFIILCMIAVGIFIISIIKNAPEFNLDNLYMKQPTIVYDKDKNVIAKLGSEKREIIHYEDMSESLVDAIIATEDSRFFQHNGVDLPRFVKASIGQVMGHDAGGASTITMQISKGNYTSTIATGFDGIKRKFTDIYMSVFKLEKKYSKKEILEFYANSNSLGAGAYGVEEACRTYFGKSARDVNVAEAAMIAGLFQAPSKYNPLLHPDDAEKRRLEVLNLMERHGYITSEEKQIASELTIDSILKKAGSGDEGDNKYQAFIDTVVEEVEKDTGDDPYDVGMEIYTTMDASKQDYINQVINGEIFNWENDKVNTGISVVNVKNGEIVAIGAGRNRSGERQYNTATMNKRQIGSTAKPLYDYGPAIEYNNWSPGTPIVDEPYSYSDGHPINNWDSGYSGLMTVRYALAQSRNIPALKTFQQVDNSSIREFVTALGLSPEVAENGRLHEAHAIGAYNGESAVSMSGAYAAFANKGVFNSPHSYTKIVYRDNGEEKPKNVTVNKVMSEQTAYLVYDSLVTTSTVALGTFANVNGYKFAAKTGTTNYDTQTKINRGLPDSAIPDLWVVGCDADYSIGIWYGYNDNKDTSYYLNFGNRENLKLFQTVAKGVFTGAQVERPSGIVDVAIEKGSWPVKLPSSNTPGDLIVTDMFKEGTEPTEVSTRFEGNLQNVTGLAGSIEGSNVILSWNAAPTPSSLDSNAIRNDLNGLYYNVQSGINSRLNYQRKYIGNVGYDIYVKNSSGALVSIGSTESTNFKGNISQFNSGKLTIVVKTAYTVRKVGTSSGVEITLDYKHEITSSLAGDKVIKLKKNDEYKDPGVIIYENGKPVTDTSKIAVTIKATGKKNKIPLDTNTISNITKVPDTYEVVYTVYYDYGKKYTATLKREVIVEE